MTNIIFTITLICLITFTTLAQTPTPPRFYCSYGEGNGGVELCGKIQMSSFGSNQHAEKAVDMILKPVGLRRNFVLFSCSDIDNAAAVTYDDGVRYVVYDNAFMERIDRGSNTDWASLSILAHEIGHHLQGHTTRLMHRPPTREDLQQSRTNELEADEFSGFVLFKLGATLAQAQAAINNLSDIAVEELSTHPKRLRRLDAISQGFSDAKAQQPIANIDSRPSAETFFSKAIDFHNQQKYREAVENYTAAIVIKPDYAYAYYGRGVSKQVGFQDYRGAIEDYNQSIRLDPQYAQAFYGRGYAKHYGNQDYRGAIEDYTQAIRLNPTYAEAFYARGYSREDVKDYRGAMEDYTQAIRFKPDYGDAYYARGGAKENNQDYRGAIEDYTQAIRLKPNDADAYYARGYAKHFGNQDYRGAIEDYTQAIRFKPDYSDAYNARGVSKLGEGDTEGACKDFTKSCSMGNSVACTTNSQYCNNR